MPPEHLFLLHFSFKCFGVSLKVAQHKLSVQVFGSRFPHLFPALPAHLIPGIGNLSSPFPASAVSLELIVKKNILLKNVYVLVLTWTFFINFDEEEWNTLTQMILRPHYEKSCQP